MQRGYKEQPKLKTDCNYVKQRNVTKSYFKI